MAIIIIAFNHLISQPMPQYIIIYRMPMVYRFFYIYEQSLWSINFCLFFFHSFISSFILIDNQHIYTEGQLWRRMFTYVFVLFSNLFYSNRNIYSYMTFILCKLGSKVWCYECESINDPYCNDPFNVSFDMSLMKMCEGCCVKIVLEKNTRKSLSSIPSFH